MQQIAIVGVGLIGGSFGLGLRRAGFTGTITGVGSEASLRAALARGAIDRTAGLAAAAGEADLIYLAQPVGRIIATIRELNPHVRSETLVTDAGSTKRIIVETATQHLRRCAFIGGHPIAGKESSGFENADGSLFEGANYILTPRDSADLETNMARSFRFWLAQMGAREMTMEAGEHDYALAFSSHLPQLASTALASLAADHEIVQGPGLATATRLALSPYPIWRDILMTNTQPIEEALSGYIQKLEFIRDNLRSRAIAEEFRIGAALASRIVR